MTNIILNFNTYSDYELSILDINQDNSFDVLDIVNFVQIILGE